MPNVIRSLLTRFGFQVDSGKLAGFNQQVEAAKGRLRAATREARNFRRAAVNLGSGLRTVVGAYLGVEAVKGLTTGYTNAADGMIKFARSVGIGSDALQEWEHVGGIAGVQSEALRLGIQRLSKNFGDAKNGLSTAKRAFKDLDLDPEQFATTDEAMTAVMGQFAKMPAGMKRTQVALDLFGRGGRVMLQVADQGADEIKRLRLEAHKLGAVIGKKQAEDAERFNDQFLRFKTTIRGVRNALAAELIPRLTELLNRFLDWYRRGDNATRMLRWLRQAILGAAAAMAAFVAAKVVGWFKGLVTAAIAGVRALRALGTAGMWAQIKIFAIAAAIAALVLAIEDLFVFATGGKSLIGDLLGNSEEAAALRTLLMDFGSTLKALWAEVKPLLASLWAALAPALSALMGLVKSLIPVLGSLFKTLITVLTPVLQILAGILNILQPFLAVLGPLMELLSPVLKLMALLLTPLLLLKVLAAVLEKAAAPIAAAWKWLLSLFEKLGINWQAVNDAITALPDKIQELFAGIWNWAKSVFGKITEAGEAMWDGLVDGLKIAADKIKGFFSSIGTAAKKAWAIVTGTDKADIEPGFMKDVEEYKRLMKSIDTENMGRAGLLGLGALGMAAPIVGGLAAPSISFSGLSVYVSGTANMDSAQFQEAIRGGFKSAMLDFIKEGMSDYKPLAKS